MELKPWDRQPGEPKGAYQYFCVYRDLGMKRTIQRAAEKCEVQVSYLTNLSAGWKWVHRADQWDAEQERERTRVARQKMALQARLEAGAVDDLIKAARIAARRLLVAVASERIVLPPKTTMEPVDTAVKLKRLVAGEVIGSQEIVAKSARERLTEKMERMAQILKSHQEGGNA